MKRSSSAGKRLIPWNNDSVGRGGPTPMEVLLEWLQTPGNYEHWILTMLKGNGIDHRTVRGIDAKIKKLIRCYLSAVKVLREEGLPCDYLEGEDVDEDIEVAVLEECPEYRVLQPVLRGFDFRGICDDSDCRDDGEGARPPKRKANGVSGSSRRSKRRRSTKRAVQGNSMGQSTVEDGLRRKMETCTMEQVEEMCKLHLATAREKDECEVEVARVRLRTERRHGELVRALDKMKLQTEQRRQEMQVDFARRQNDLKLKMDTLQSRQVLKNQRVSKADIDLVLPPSALQNNDP
ncbi:hypothetical protein PF007_g4356 [Phytophthora fragariae]|uniref:Uncharacterized protein n=2 Tax=Phytophthora fragariae TaxID=53985 RepID=A0A6A3FKG5_9STRA|nr:hypothetical protein PF003_g19275 [Phytophthora fragariae]KAE8945623.1 hypothetical protein PF009_g4737 [Phytophthora fragariae]KAE9130849.1 hypothetical protein PF007_g4356 [Phytophthora fragariae]KAE9152205.1 hypothetical protein PF006_g3554 [Phytophthora fragariae]